MAKAKNGVEKEVATEALNNKLEAIHTSVDEIKQVVYESDCAVSRIEDREVDRMALLGRTIDNSEKMQTIINSLVGKVCMPSKDESSQLDRIEGMLNTVLNELLNPTDKPTEEPEEEFGDKQPIDGVKIAVDENTKCGEDRLMSYLSRCGSSGFANALDALSVNEKDAFLDGKKDHYCWPIAVVKMVRYFDENLPREKPDDKSLTTDELEIKVKHMIEVIPWKHLRRAVRSLTPKEKQGYWVLFGPGEWSGGTYKDIKKIERDLLLKLLAYFEGIPFNG